MPQAPASRAAAITRSRELGWSDRPGRRGAMPTEARTPTATSSLQRPEPLARRGRARLGRPPDVVVDGRHRERDRDVGACCGLREKLSITDDQRPAGDDVEWVRGVAQHLDARTRQPVPAFGRLVWIGGGADHDVLPRPARARELHAQAIGDVELHTDRRPVAVVRRAVGATLECAHVTEGALVDAAHVRVERPVEGHAFDMVQRDLARLFPILDPHPPMIEHMFDPSRARLYSCD